MSLSAVCPHCGSKLKPKDDHVGRRLACPKCREPFVVTVPESEEPVPAEPASTQAEDSPAEASESKRAEPEATGPEAEELSAESLSELPDLQPLDNADFGDLDSADSGTGGDSLDDLSADNDLLGDNLPEVDPDSLAEIETGDVESLGDDDDPLGLSDVLPSDAQLPPAQLPMQSENKRDGMSGRMIGLIAAGSVGGLCLLVGMIFTGIWLFGSSDDSNTGEVTDAGTTTSGSSDGTPDTPDPDPVPTAPKKSAAARESAVSRPHDNAKDTIAEPTTVPSSSGSRARVVAPEVLERPFGARVLESEAAGTAIQLADSHHILRMAFDARTGNCAMTLRVDKEVFLYVCHPEYFDGDQTAVAGPLRFDWDDYHVAFCFRPLEDQTLLVLSHKGIIWSLDPQTLQPVDLVLNPIDLHDGRYDELLRPTLRPNQQSLFVKDEVSRLRARPQPDDPTVIYKPKPKRSTSSDVTGYELNLKTGELTGSVIWPPPGTIGAGEMYNERSLSDPYEEFTVDTRGVRRGETFEKWERGPRDHLPICVLESHPWIIARGPVELFFYDRSNLADTVTLAVPRLFQTPPEMHNTMPATCVFEDGDRDRLLMATNSLHDDARWGALWLLPMTEAALPDNPLLVALLELPELIEPGQPVAAPVEVRDERVSVSVASGPQGARLAEGVLEWTPQLSDVGLQEIVLRASAGDRHVDRKFPYTVQFAPVPVPFEVFGDRMHLRPDGAGALAWNNYPRKKPREYDDPQIALIGVRNRKIVATRRLKHRIAEGVLASQRVFLLSQDGFTLEVCSLNDLEPIETFPLTEHIRGLTVLNDRLLFLSTGEQRTTNDSLGEFFALELPDFRETRLTRILSGAPAFTRFGRTTDGWLVGPVVLDEELQTIHSLHTLCWAAPYYISSTYSVRESVGPEGFPVTKVSGPPNSRRRDETSLPLGDGTLTITTNTVELHRHAVSRRPTVQLHVQFTSSDEGAQPVEIPLAIYEQLHEEKSILAEGAGVVVVANRRPYTFYPADLGVELPGVTRPAGLTLRAQKHVSELSTSEKTTIQFNAEGGRRPYEFSASISKGYMGTFGRDAGFQEFQEKVLQVDAESGAVTVDGALLASTLLDREAESIASSGSGPRGLREPNPMCDNVPSALPCSSSTSITAACRREPSSTRKGNRCSVGVSCCCPTSAKPGCSTCSIWTSPGTASIMPS